MLLARVRLPFTIVPQPPRRSAVRIEASGCQRASPVIPQVGHTRSRRRFASANGAWSVASVVPEDVQEDPLNVVWECRFESAKWYGRYGAAVAALDSVESLWPHPFNQRTGGVDAGVHVEVPTGSQIIDSLQFHVLNLRRLLEEGNARLRSADVCDEAHDRARCQSRGSEPFAPRAAVGIYQRSRYHHERDHTHVDVPWGLCFRSAQLRALNCGASEEGE
jgi:hypothetical protein